MRKMRMMKRFCAYDEAALPQGLVPGAFFPEGGTPHRDSRFKCTPDALWRIPPDGQPIRTLYTLFRKAALPRRIFFYDNPEIFIPAYGSFDGGLVYSRRNRKGREWN